MKKVFNVVVYTLGRNDKKVGEIAISEQKRHDFFYENENEMNEHEIVEEILEGQYFSYPLGKGWKFIITKHITEIQVSEVKENVK